jgi:hypothetical protein
VCFNLFHVIRELGQLSEGTRVVYLHLSSRVPLVDHTTGESLRHFLEEFSGQDQTPRLVIEGWDHMRPMSNHETSTRIALAATEKVAKVAKVATVANVAFTDRVEHELRLAQTTD